MNFDPQKFFIGLMDFFSILLPGALLTRLLMDKAGPVVLGDHYAEVAGAEAWATFLFASYLLGHLVFLLGTWLDELYDWARRFTLNSQIRLLARRGRLLPWLARTLIWLVFKHERNLAVNRAGMIKRHALDALQAKDAVNTFQWSKAWLNAESPASLALVQRFEADSKFFRSFTVVLLLLLASWPWQDHLPLAGIPVLLGLLLLALWRYMEQRFKATNLAYWSVITLTARDSKLGFDVAATKAGSPTHAGGVVFRTRSGNREYLLVEAKDDPSLWVLPKGHVEEGEQQRETAVREVVEETGVWARVVRDLGETSWSLDGVAVTTRFFLMQALGRGRRRDRDRQHDWFTLEAAVARAMHPETKNLLESADRQRSTE